jgi:hypothetical protein
MLMFSNVAWTQNNHNISITTSISKQFTFFQKPLKPFDTVSFYMLEMIFLMEKKSLFFNKKINKL